MILFSGSRLVGRTTFLMGLETLSSRENCPDVSPPNGSSSTSKPFDLSMKPSLKRLKDSNSSSMAAKVSP